MDNSIQEINRKVKDASADLSEVLREIGKVIVGQRYLIERLFIGLLADGHVLLEGVPGLAKTLSVRTLARAINATANMRCVCSTGPRRRHIVPNARKGKPCILRE